MKRAKLSPEALRELDVANSRVKPESKKTLLSFLNKNRRQIKEVQNYLDQQNFSGPYYYVNGGMKQRSGKIVFDATGSVPKSLSYCVYHLLIDEPKTTIFDSKGRIVLTNTDKVMYSLDTSFKRRNLVFDEKDLRKLKKSDNEIKYTKYLMNIFSLSKTTFSFFNEYAIALGEVLQDDPGELIAEYR